VIEAREMLFEIGIADIGDGVLAGAGALRRASP
jgi:hypothetical protein